MSRFLPPSKVTNSTISRSILGDGCVVRSGCRVDHSVVGLRALINEGCTVEDSLLMGADYYETLEECALIPSCLPMGLGTQPLLPRHLLRPMRCKALCPMPQLAVSFVQAGESWVQVYQRSCLGS